MKYKPKTKRWFIKRIGKRIYRDHHKCCNHCDEAFENGLIVIDRQHADYLASIDHDLANEGIYLNYRDTKNRH